MLPAEIKAFQGEEHQPFILNGGKPAALFVHGFPGTPAEMRLPAATLHEAGWTVRAPLLPGFGTEIETIGEKTCADWLAVIEDELTALQREHHPVILVGNSMGGALSIQIAATRPNPPDALILFAPFWKVQHILWTLLPALRLIFPKPRLFRWIRLNLDDPEVQAGIREFMPDIDLDDPVAREAILDYRLPVNMFAQIHRAGEDAHRFAPRVKCPTLIVQGDEDELVRPWVTEKLAQRFNGAVTYHTVRGQHQLTTGDLEDWPQIQTHIRQFAGELAQRPT